MPVPIDYDRVIMQMICKMSRSLSLVRFSRAFFQRKDFILINNGNLCNKVVSARTGVLCLIRPRIFADMYLVF
jgi:hypothetical protein